MSILHSRIMAQAGTEAPVHPWGTQATPMVMPLAAIQYSPDEQALYGTLHPLYSADGAVIAALPHSYIAGPEPAPAVPAGRP